MSPELKEMREQLEKLTNSIQEREAFEKEQAIAQIADLMYKNEITLADLEQALRPSRKRKGTNGAAKAEEPRYPPKYLNPSTGDTWSGMGRAPAWIKDKKREKFLIQ